jgi:pimeloyl-ACP methyl ester carboxylesterase
MRGMTEFGYADDGAYIAYRIDGDGPIDIVQQPDWPGNIDLDWDDAWSGGWLRELSSMGRLIAHDQRGVGLSSRNVAIPTLELGSRTLSPCSRSWASSDRCCSAICRPGP